VTADLLRRVDVTLDGDLVRRYGFDYTTGAFAKTLLSSISQYDENGALFNTHTFDYFDDIRDGQADVLPILVEFLTRQAATSTATPSPPAVPG
jgi:hypothetical protein